MSLARRHHDLFPRLHALHSDLWAEHDRMMKRHFEIVDRMWEEIDREFFSDHKLFLNGHREQRSLQGTSQSGNDVDIFPKVCSEDNVVTMKMQVPERIDQTKLKVSNKDGDLVVNIDDKTQSDDGGCRSVSYFSQTTMPKNTDYSGLKWVLDDKTNVLTVTAPLKTE